MPKRGRKPTPQALHALHGTDRADRHGTTQLEPGTELGPCPEHLDDYGREFWDWAAGQYEAVKIPPADAVSMAGMADYYSRWMHGKKTAPDGGFYTCEKTGNPRRHPADIAGAQALKELRLMMTANGLSIEGRAGSEAPEPEEGEWAKRFRMLR